MLSMKLVTSLMAVAACLMLASGGAAKPARKARPPAAKPVPAEATAAPAEAPAEEGGAAGNPQPETIDALLPPPEQAAQPAEAAPEATPAPTSVKLPAPVMTNGEKLRYRIVGRDETKGPNGAQSRDNDQTIEIE